MILARDSESQFYYSGVRDPWFALRKGFIERTCKALGTALAGRRCPRFVQYREGRSPPTPKRLSCPCRQKRPFNVKPSSPSLTPVAVLRVAPQNPGSSLRPTRASILPPCSRSSRPTFRVGVPITSTIVIETALPANSRCRQEWGALESGRKAARDGRACASCPLLLRLSRKEGASTQQALLPDHPSPRAQRLSASSLTGAWLSQQLDNGDIGEDDVAFRHGLLRFHGLATHGPAAMLLRCGMWGAKSRDTSFLL